MDPRDCKTQAWTPHNNSISFVLYFTELRSLSSIFCILSGCLKSYNVIWNLPRSHQDFRTLELYPSKINVFKANMHQQAKKILQNCAPFLCCIYEKLRKSRRAQVCDSLSTSPTTQTAQPRINNPTLRICSVSQTSQFSLFRSIEFTVCRIIISIRLFSGTYPSLFLATLLLQLRKHLSMNRPVLFSSLDGLFMSLEPERNRIIGVD